MYYYIDYYLYNITIMKLSAEVVDFIKNADHKALATHGEDGVNVVPLSMITVDKEHIIICDCFMDKTRNNVRQDPQAALAFWKGFDGVQVKGTIVYEKEGDRFGQYADKLKVDHPDRQLCGVLVFTPDKVYDLSPKNAGKQLA